DPGNEDFFAAGESDARYLFDLPGYVGRRLSALALAAVEAVFVDSCADEERFFSYRRAARRGEKAYGRGLSAIVLDAGAGPRPGPGDAG
ncbi:MAG: laccase domain-containing protein, partial [Alphaproteobacteria bacterium]|nr:laccase domain-containing protein [Alphaproteobacteria bacterium]